MQYTFVNTMTLLFYIFNLQPPHRLSATPIRRCKTVCLAPRVYKVHLIEDASHGVVHQICKKEEVKPCFIYSLHPMTLGSPTVQRSIALQSIDCRLP